MGWYTNDNLIDVLSINVFAHVIYPSMLLSIVRFIYISIMTFFPATIVIASYIIIPEIYISTHSSTASSTTHISFDLPIYPSANASMCQRSISLSLHALNNLSVHAVRQSSNTSAVHSFFCSCVQLSACSSIRLFIHRFQLLAHLSGGATRVNMLQLHLYIRPAF